MNFGSLIGESAWALPVAFAGGVLAGMNPCCLALYPAVTAACCASGGGQRPRVVASRAAAFVAGGAFATTALGMVAASLGHAIVLLGRWPRYALALVPVAMGLHLLGWLQLPLPPIGRAWPAGRTSAAFGAGLFSMLVLGACGTPVLAAILSLAAYQGDVAFGGSLLFVYGVGSGLPVFLVGTSAAAIAGRFEAKGRGGWIQPAAGTLLVFSGLFLLTRV